MIKPWPPTRFSEPLVEDFPSVFGNYKLVFRIAWQEARGYQLEEWQEQLLCAITELRPDGHLRWRQVLVSVGRQCGKSEIAAALGLLFMLWQRAPLVIGIASSADQARLVYDRTMDVIKGNPSLLKRFDKITDTRGIASITGGKYEIKASKTAALQGLPIDLGVVDEVHLIKQALWTDLVNGTGGRPDCMVVGITTAGDDSSELLKHLYEVESDSLGKFIWESPQAVVPDSDDELIEFLRAANPALASGRIDPRVVLEDVRSMPKPDVIRYRLNRFISGVHGFITGDLWAKCRRGPDESLPVGARVVFAVDRTPSWSAATITATVKDGDVTWTEVVASVPMPSLEGLGRICDRIAAKHRGLWVMDGYGLRDLADAMKKKGRQVRVTNQAEVCSASALLFRAVASEKLRHGGEPLLSVQVPASVRKPVGEGFRIVGSGAEIDGVIATALGVWGAEQPVKTRTYKH